MKEKLLILMKNEGLKPGQFAEKVGVNAAGISHILAGRNKPGFDLLQKILRAFPRVNPDWLLLDSDQVYRDEDGDPAEPSVVGGQTSASDLPPVNPDVQPASLHPQPTSASDDTERPFHTGGLSKQVARVVILYTDGTCESYTPDK